MIAFRIAGWAGLMILALSVPATAVVSGQEDEDDDAPGARRPGLIAVYTDAANHAVPRVDPAIHFDWRADTPDRRCVAGPFRAAWRGCLQASSAGPLRLAVYLQGRVRVELDGRVWVAGQADRPQWLTSPLQDLSYDLHPLQVTYERTGATGRLALYWESPSFTREPIAPRYFVQDAEPAPDDAFHRGERLFRQYRCGRCHDVEGEPVPPAAPSLSHAGEFLRREWLISTWAAAGAERATELPACPPFDLSADEARAVAAALRSQVAAVSAPEAAADTLPRGQHLFLTRGCLACHQWGELGRARAWDGGDLSRIAAKRPAAFFPVWLSAPASIDPDHRMPVFDWTPEEAAALAAFLATLGENEAVVTSPVTADDPAVVARGQRLIAELHCDRCHRLGESPATRLSSRPHLGGDAAWHAACDGSADRARGRPGYGLPAADAAAVRQFVREVASPPAHAADEGPRLFEEWNCLGCHQRDEMHGLSATLVQLSQAYPELAPRLPAMRPPVLTSIGDKLHDAALHAALTPDFPPRRPWLLVRMPRFRLDESQRGALVDWLIEADRIPGAPIAGAGELPAAVVRRLESAGSRLVTSDGFGCTSCHAVGRAVPPAANLAALGPDLASLAQRIRPDWFHRWVRNPTRIVPRMEMPSVQLPVRGVLDDQLDQQLAAVWHVLNLPGFEPPAAHPVRIVRRAGISDLAERAVALTDVLRWEGQPLIKPLLIGLPNRHSVLFDLQQRRLVAWQLGDVARQRTEGKVWFWELAGYEVQRFPAGASDLRLRYADHSYAPQVRGQFVTEIDALAAVDGGLEWRHRLHYELPGQTSVLHVVERLVARGYATDASRGFVRHLEIRGLPRGGQAVLQLADGAHAVTDDNGRQLLLDGETMARVRVVEPRASRIATDGSVAWPPRGETAATATITLDYQCDLPLDTYPPSSATAAPRAPQPLQIVPGYDAVQLPLPDEIMPTGLAWRPDGTLVVTSLQGGVWLGRDTDADGLEDRLQLFADGLAAPYGVATSGTAIDVINKYALLRLSDDDQDGEADRLDTLASGWGHTADYHDWAVGLPRDQAGNYYVALPCQQDDRAMAAAAFRGRLLRLVPRTPTDDHPQAFTLQVVSTGHRFPMGLAFSADGQLFVTDNQGNYNPFNELNHVRDGADYGFVNALEARQARSQPPAIDIPHPWTRSVNGICLLGPPAPGRVLFGPFEGHLLGCEYDTRRLVRMSLERVGETYQGAVYPFSRDPAAGGDALLGPLVCGVAPSGDLYIGSIRDSGWGGGNNIGSLVRLRPQPGRLPAGIAEVRAAPDGLVIRWTQPLAIARLADVHRYRVESYRRVATPEYGGPDRDRRDERILAAEPGDDGASVTLRLPELRADHVYEVRATGLVGDGVEFFPAEAHYTMRCIPAAGTITVPQR